MIKITKKRVVLFLLFIFPLICFLVLSSGKNNFNKLPLIPADVLDVSDISKIDSTQKVAFLNNISIVCFLGNDIDKNKTGFLNLNEKIYKKFVGFNNFQIIALYPKENQLEATNLQKEIGAFTEMIKWKFVGSSKQEINALYASLKADDPLSNFYTPKVYLIDKNGNLRGRTDTKDNLEQTPFGYNTNSVSELKTTLKEDVNVLYYEYYAAFKNKNTNKADREN